MKAIEIKTGLKREELEQMYINYINALIDLGASEKEAREIVQETLKECLK